MIGKLPHNAKSRDDDWYLPAWVYRGVTFSVPTRTADKIPQDNHRVGSLKETPMLWTLTWSHSGEKRKMAGGETMEI